ncbi:hypothetical protein HBI45_122960 [Parastagonospora nodorum]|nr:hypothetical protein HBI45_122960 [Parastagonospora nodorum]
MSPIYGEGREHALARLMEQIEKQPDTGISRLEAQQKKKVMRSLWFEQFQVRHTTIETAHAQTCRWLLSNCQFSDWLNPEHLTHHHGVLWIKGKPGTGKSTVMKFALAHVQETMKDSVVIHFFFNARGEEIERSTVGTYRALLLQLLTRIPKLQYLLDPLVGSTLTLGVEVKWDLQLLKSMLKKAIQTLDATPVVCFIDALDECEEQQIRDMLAFFERVSELSLSPGTRFQLCFSSRHYPNITIKAGLSLVLERQEGHAQDIVKYIQSELKIGESKIARQIQDDLQKKASGVFMWVVLVVGILRQEYDHGHIHTLSRRLKEIPADLHELFRDILTRDSRNETDLILCIQWVLYTKQPLRPAQLYYAVLAGVDPHAVTSWDPEENSQDDISRFILDASKGLTALASRANIVQFIHESVRDFLLNEDGLASIWPALKTNLEGQSHERLKQCCLAYMGVGVHFAAIRGNLRTTFLHEVQVSRDSIHSRFPFLSYAVQNVLYHANQAGAAHITQQDFLKDFPFILWSALDGLFEYNQALWYEDNVSSLYILASRNLSNLIEVHPSVRSCFEVEQGRYGTPFLAAMATGSREAVYAFIKALSDGGPGENQCQTFRRYNTDNDGQYTLPQDFRFPKQGNVVLVLVEHKKDTVLALVLPNCKVDVNAKDNAGRTAVVLAIQQGCKSIVELLLSTGRIDVNTKKITGRTPLMWAIRHGRKDMVDLLLNTGKVEINAEDAYGWTPLMWAVQQARKDIIELIFSTDKSTDKVDVNAKSKSGSTAVMEAAANGYSSIVAILLSTGKVDIGARNDRGESALMKAEKNGHGDIVQMLQSYCFREK